MKSVRIPRALGARVAGNRAIRESLQARRALMLVVCLGVLLGSAGCIGLAGTPGGKTANSGSTTGQLSASAAQLNFGNVTVGSPTALLVSLTNTGQTNITIGSVAASGSGFSASGGANVILTPSQSVTVSVNFAPASAGAVSGQLVVASDASNSSLQVGLSGTGVMPSGQHSVTLNWQPSTSSVIGYYVYRGSTSSNMTKLNAAAEPSTSFTDSNVASGQTYVYAVTAVDANNVESTYSNEVAVTIPGS